MQQPFDRAAEDLGNSIHFEHVNVTVPDQRLATLFYVAGLGLTRDPYLMVSDTNMWVNVGKSQFHLPDAAAQVLRGHTGIVIAGREALLARLASVAKKLEGTAFAFSEHNDHVEADLPLGQPRALLRAGRRALRAHHARHSLCRVRCAGRDRESASARSIPQIMGMPAEFLNGDGAMARVKVGKDQYLQFRETDRRQPDYDGHHVQIYITDFSGPYHRLRERGLVSQEDNQYQYRFRDIIDLDGGRHLFTVEHEIRSATHPMFMRPLVNRNPAETNRTYAPGHEAMGLGDGTG